MADIKLSGSGLGVASLALQIGDCVIRLKGFWDAVKEAPEEIKNLIEEIETLSLVLSGFEDGEHPEHNATVGGHKSARLGCFTPKCPCSTSRFRGFPEPKFTLDLRTSFVFTRRSLLPL
jgi:hypothetical protein